MAKFRKKPVVIEAIQLSAGNSIEVAKWCGARVIQPGNPGFSEAVLSVPTLEGPHTASSGDWIIKGVQGEFYPCKPDIFSETYEPVEDA